MQKEKRAPTLPGQHPHNSHGDSNRWGATTETWQHFVDLGLTADLLPVVANPNATISIGSTIKSPGKLPSRYNGNGHLAGFRAWTSHITTAEDIARWQKQPDYGICLQTRTVRAIDVDVDDFDESLDIENAIRARLGFDLPCRRRADSCKLAVVFRLPGDYTKRKFPTSKGLVEFLATGQQLVISGTHPGGARYEWVGGLPNDIPALTPEQFERLWAALVQGFAVGASTMAQPPVRLERPRSEADTDDPLVDWLYANWHVHGTDRSGRVDIVCPFEGGTARTADLRRRATFRRGWAGRRAGTSSACTHRARGGPTRTI